MTATTFKITMPLMQSLSAASTRTGKTKGALIREALQMYLKRFLNQSLEVEEITKALIKGRKPRISCDWDALYKKTRIPCDLTPEEEVRLSRTRGFE